MNPYVARIKKDLVPRVVINGYQTYMGFVHETSKKPLRYFDFLHGYGSGRVEEVTPYEDGDYIYPLNISYYFEMNDRLMGMGAKYNLMKKRHEYNTRKYGKIRSKSNTV